MPTQVVPVTVPPAIGKPEMLSGIRTIESARRWGEKNGYAQVYYLESRQRVYADKTQKTSIPHSAVIAVSRP